MATMALLKQDGTNLRKLKPPTRYASMHADLVTMSTHFDKAVDYYTKGLNTIDASQFDLGNQEIQLANSALDSAQEELNALR